MKFFVFFSILICLSYSTTAQVKNTDSLLSILDTISNQEDQIKFCMKQGDQYAYTDLDSFEFWYKNGIEIGINSKHKYMLVMLYAYWSYEYDARGDYEKQAELIHKGKTYLNDKTPFIYRRSIMAAEAEYNLRVGNQETAIKINLSIIELAKEIGDSVALSGTLHNLGINYYYLKDYDKTDSLIKEAYAINQIIGQELYAINNLSMLANIEKERGNFKEALAYNLEVQGKYVEMNEISGMTFIKSNIAENYWDLGNKKLAYLYADSCLILAKEYNLKEWEWTTYSRLSSFYEEDKNYKKSLEYYKLYSETKSKSVNEQSSTKLESLTSELNESKLAILEQNEALQVEKIKLQDEKIKSQNSENAKNRIQRLILIGGLIIAALFGFFVYNRLKLTNKQNKIIEEQKEKVQLAFEEIAEKNLDITASINYAKRIQNAILPTTETLNSNLKEHFVLFKPKDLVSGDFYWTEMINDHTFIAVGDCTGHGVPGALVSVICHNALDRAVKEFNLVDPAEILNKTREIVIEQFEKSNEDVKDGMDIALCAIKNSTKELSFAGANNPLWILRNNEILVTKGDKQPIGVHSHLESFVSHKIQTQVNDIFYIFSDGYADQFGGEKGKKFKSKSMARLLSGMISVPLRTQGKHLDVEFEKWKSDFEQLDDVCVVGFRL